MFVMQNIRRKKKEKEKKKKEKKRKKEEKKKKRRNCHWKGTKNTCQRDHRRKQTNVYLYKPKARQSQERKN